MRQVSCKAKISIVVPSSDRMCMKDLMLSCLLSKLWVLRLRNRGCLDLERVSERDFSSK